VRIRTCVTRGCSPRICCGSLEENIRSIYVQNGSENSAELEGSKKEYISEDQSYLATVSIMTIWQSLDCPSSVCGSCVNSCSQMLQ